MINIVDWLIIVRQYTTMQNKTKQNKAKQKNKQGNQNYL
jgi:hypothetical protein